MSDNSSNNKRLAKNTMFMYIRMVFLMVIGLYASRVILQTLGIPDYGLYNVVGGVVAMFGFLNSTLSTSTQRFLNVEIVKGNIESVKKVFSNALFLHLMLVIIVFILAETVGLWYVRCRLVIPEGRENAAMWVYQFSIISICIQIFQLPFMSTIIAHERMGIYAYVSIFEGMAKLGILFLLQVLNYDKLILYGALILGVQVSVALMYNIYCRKHFAEASLHIVKEKHMFREMLNFSGWNIVGSLATVCNGQGINLLLNAFFGTVVNAARGISFQIHGLISQLISNFQIAVRPQVIKYYAAGQINEMVDLVFNSARYSAFLMLIVNVPIMVEINSILHFWLGEYPSYTPIFVRIILLRSIIYSMTGPIVMVVHASGYLKNVGIFSGGSLIMVLPFSYIFLKLGLPPYIPFLVDLFGALTEAFFELFWMKKYIQFPMMRFYKEVYGKVLVILSISLLCTAALHFAINGIPEIARMLLVVILSILFSTFSIYRFAFDEPLKQKLKNMVLSKLKK